MTGRRKDMWKLLYNLVNRNKANLSAVYHVVDDILCQDPSLISCSSMDELQNEFQDIFLLWLLNKLSVCLNECKDEGQCLKNVQLQQKLLTSCWCNHPKLYKGIIIAYLDALQQLHDLMSAFDYTSPGKNDKEARLLHLRIFRGDISVLQEFDTDCSFEVISVQLEHSDALAKYLLLVLQHAHHISHATHGKQFVESLQQALLCFKEFNMDTKLTALGYCHAVLKAQTEHTWQTQPEVAHYACLTLRATSMLWSLCSRFLAAQCMTSQQMDLLANHTEQLLELLQPQQLPDPESLELSCQMLHELLRHKQDNAWGASLLETLSVYLQHKLQQSGENQQLPSQTTRLLLCEWQRLPNELLPLLAVLAVHNKAVSDLILGNLNLRLLELLQKPSPAEIPLLLQLLRALKQMEQLLLLQQQQEVVKISTEALHSQLLASLPLQHELHLPMAANWNQMCLQLLEQPQCSSASTQLVEISAQMLQLNCIRLQLKPHTQQQLLGMTLQQPLPALQALSTLRLETPSSAHTQLQSYYTQQHLRLLNEEHLELRQRFCAQLPQLYVAGYIKAAQLLQALPRLKIRDDDTDDDSLASVLRLLLCTQQAGAAHVFQVEQRIVLHCAKCAPLPAELPGIYLGCCRSSGLKLNASNLPDLAAAVMFKPKCGFISHHLDLIQLEPTHCLRLLKESCNPQSLNLRSFERLVPVLSAQSSDFMLQLGKHVLTSIGNILGKPLEEQSESEQRFWLRLIVCSAHQQLDELWLFHWFKMTFYLLVHTRSLVAQEAVLAACQLCANHGLQPLTLWNWYKRDAVALVVQLALHAYLNEGVRFTRSLRALSKMLGFSCVQEFICKYHRLLTTLVLPYCIREPRCKGVFVLMSKQLGKPISALFSISFLRLYTHVYLTEQPEIANRCIELVASCTKSSLQQLMNADVKQTVAELLIYFNRNPTFVMRSFQSLLQLTLGAEEELSSQAVNAQFATFIAERILGVITYFESCLSEPSFEKLLKEETLLSLGQILRFVGPQHVTQFRFKIIAMLSFVHTLKEPQLQRICLNIWHIFLHVVNIQELGPSLGRIVATLQPLLEYSVEQVNELYEFVILRNAAMLGNYIQDLYFLENLEQISTPIRDCIRRHTAQLCLAGPAAGQEETTPLLDQLRFLHKQISNECLQVRVYGLEHLAELFGRRRHQLNQMLLNALPLEPLMEQLVHTLMSGCQHDDRSLQLASAKCMGQLGAIDASYLPSNYNFATAQALPLSVLTDDFTVLALTALCTGYQSQQQTKHVDSFALAIQETLAVCGIVPKEQKKLQLWQSLPQRMREIMEPLLSSCYICSNRPNTLKQQPLFGSHYTANSYELWAYLWATRLVDYVQSAQTRHLLSSYKPCIRRDTNMLSTFYPYVLLHALLECNAEQRLHIEQEFQAVLQANDELSQQQQQTKTASEQGVKIFESRKYGAGNRSTMEQPESASKPEDQSRLAGKLCAELLDFLERWLREWQRLHGMSTSGKPPQDVDSSYKAIYEFLQSMDKLQVARASYNCGEYERALRYLEAYIAAGDKSQLLLEQFTFLVEIYGRLMDADSVEGAVQTRSCDMSVTQEILVNRLVERQQDMITCYEQLLTSNEQLQPTHIRAMVDAYLRMDTPKTALLIADGLAQRLSDQRMDEYFSECKAELLWRLGSYDELDELEQASKRCTPNWHAQCAKACLALREETTTKLQFDGLLDGMRGSVLEQLRSCSSQQQHSYAHAYDHVLKLHMLHELQCSQLLMEQLQQQPEEQQAEQLMRDYFEDWQCRLQVVQPQLRVLEPIYSFRRNLLAELQRRLGSHATLQNQLQTQLAQIWLQSAQINRNAGQLQRAHLYLMKASAYKPSGLFVERAKLLWQKGDQVLAMNYLEEQLNTIKRQCDGNTKQLPEEQRQLYFEGKYLQATYNADSMNLCADAILKYFQEAIAVQRQSERCYVQLAQFLEKMREARGAATSSAASSSREEEELLLQIMLNYAKSLRYGNQHVYQSMPRLISLWLDTAATPSTSATYPELVRKMNDLLNNCCTALPTAMFYTAYSQMLSRLCHPSPDVFAVLRNVIIKLITDYPQQSLWMLLPHFKSAAVNRIKRCKLILTDSRLQNPTFERLLNDFNSLTERLIGVTNKEVTLDRTYKLSDLDKRLTLLCSQPNFSNILLPFEKYMQPAFSLSCTPDASTITQEKLPSSNWFPYQQIYISGFQEKLLVLRSAARPKKLTIRCSDGQDYDIMVKPKDDLRKDARLMEFNGLMKRYLHQDAHARQRRLHIRTYAVLPFNEECGLLEWLPNLNSYRSICIALYAQRGKVMSGRQLQQLAVPQMETPERKRDVFLKQLQPAHPPVFQEWLLQRFTTPHSWYEARNSYIRTVAVMSMVGYILGLGDRHGENILFDERNGDAVHVDFNCLFNQGEAFAYPEVVPFRLTHNMITAMGPLGVEGSYRKCCEITLRLLKQETKTLMSMLRPFVYDLGVQSRLAASTASKNKAGAELTDPKVTNDVKRIAERLQGHVKRQQANSIPLSTEGQVNFLINEATKVDNLAAMYIGWGAFL